MALVPVILSLPGKLDAVQLVEGSSGKRYLHCLCDETQVPELKKWAGLVTADTQANIPAELKRRGNFIHVWAGVKMDVVE
jgi:hypothetical protein